MGRGQTRSEHKNTRGSKYKMTYVHPHTYINKQISPIFNCVTPESVSLASLARQLYNPSSLLLLLQSQLLLYSYLPHNPLPLSVSFCWVWKSLQCRISMSCSWGCGLQSHWYCHHYTMKETVHQNGVVESLHHHQWHSKESVKCYNINGSILFIAYL